LWTNVAECAKIVTGGRANLKQRTARWLAWASLLGSIALFLGGQMLLLAIPAASFPVAFRSLQVVAGTFLGFTAVGALIMFRRGEVRIGLVTCATGLLGNLWVFAFDYLGYATAARRNLPAVEWIAWLAHWLWLPDFLLLAGLLPLLFPDGRLPSPRWRPVVWLLAATSLIGVVALALGPNEGNGMPRNPVGLAAAAGFLTFLQNRMNDLSIVGIALAAAAVVVRFLRAKGDQRLQMKWFTSAVAFLALVTMPLIVFRLPIFELPAWAAVLYGLAMLSLPVAIGIALFKYRLYDINVVLSKTLVLGALAAFIMAVYIGVVVAVGLLIGTGGSPNLWLSVLATALVALAFQPFRERVQRLANRLVYGKRPTPYEVMAQFSHWVAGALSIDEVLPRIAEAAARGVGARRCRIRLLLPSGSQDSVTWPAGSDGDVYDLTVSVVHQGETVGEIAIRKSPGETLTPVEETLLRDLAAQAAPVLRNGRLAAELAERLRHIQIQARALAASRTRIVQAEEAGRRRIERDIHDGVQQEIVALIAKVSLARNQLARESPLAAVTLAELQEEAQLVLTELRELARGIHPAVLEDRGLLEAIQTRAGRLPIGVRIQVDAADRDARYPPEIEGAAYFLVSEALTNVLKHASAREVEVRLASDDGRLRVEVLDDGCGFDPAVVPQAGLRGLRDRIEALGGTLRVLSGPAGTRLSADLPAGAGRHV
jgi:signal transduction histidine kinase